MNKRNILPLVSLLVVGLLYEIPSFAQTSLSEHSFEPGIGYTTDAAHVFGNWIAPYNAIDCHTNRIAVINSTTDAINYFATDFNVYNILQTGPDSMLCAGVQNYGGDVISFVNARISKMDSAGKVSWSAIFRPDDSINKNTIFPFSRLAVGHDGSIYALAPGHYLAKTTANGNKKWIRRKNLSDMVMTDRGLLVAQGHQLALLDTGGSAIWTYNFTNNDSIEMLRNTPSGVIYAISGSHVFRINSSFQPVDSFAFYAFQNKKVNNLPLGVQGFNAALSDSLLFCTCGDSISCYNLAGNTMWKAGLPSDVVITGVSLYNTQLAVTGYQNYDHPFLKTYSTDGKTLPIHRSISISRVIPVKYDVPYNNGSPMDLNATFDIVIRNTGHETVDSVYLESEGALKGPQYGCSELTLAGFFKLHLAPGDTARLHNISLTRYHSIIPGQKNSISIQFSSASPNGRLDSSASSANFIFIDTLAGIHNTANEMQQISVYPNPVSGALHITNPTGLPLTIAVADITGKTLMLTRDNTIDYQLNTQSLKPGMYLVKVMGKTDAVVWKIVKKE